MQLMMAVKVLIRKAGAIFMLSRLDCELSTSASNEKTFRYHNH